MNKSSVHSLAVTTRLLIVILAMLLTTRLSAKQRFGNPIADTAKATISHFWVKDEYDRETDLAALKSKVVFINFWALSCIPCKAEMPSINQLASHFKDDTSVVFFLIDLDNDFLHSVAYFKEKDYMLKIYAIGGEVPEMLFQGDIPTTAIMDKTGRIVFFQVGQEEYNAKKFIDLIDGLSKK